MYQVFTIDPGTAESVEQLGTKYKYWFKDPQGKHQLFKADSRGTGEDWAEKIACELAELLGVPHVHYELAFELNSELPGVICESCAAGYTGLALGNQLLLARDQAYPADQSNKYYRVRQHTVDAVAQVLNAMARPPDKWTRNMPPGLSSALDVFAGYVLLDAWIANQDRHHENWGALRMGTALYLAPSFDHGAALARNLLDTQRQDRLQTRNRARQISAYARRARSAFYRDFSSPKPMNTIEAWQAFAQRTSVGMRSWPERLRSVTRDAIKEVITKVPENRMTQVCRDFMLELLLENQRRILAGDSQ